MGAAVSVVVALIFLGFLTAATMTYSAVDYSRNLVKNAQYDRDAMNKEKMQTDITIVNITTGSSLNITLKNTGKITLNASALNVFVNGTLYKNGLLSSGSTWTPKNNTIISVQMDAAPGDNRVKVVTQNGASDYYILVI